MDTLLSGFQKMANFVNGNAPTTHVDETGCVIKFPSVKEEKQQSFRKENLKSKHTQKMEILRQEGFNDVRPHAGPGLVNAVIHGYNQHVPIKFSPDHVWVTIVYAFAHHIDNHAEAYRKYFVDHEGKKDITVYIAEQFSELISVEGVFEKCTEKFLDEIRKNVKDDEFIEWVSTEFSTSTNLDRIVKNIGLMASVKSYFNFKVVSMCGLSKIKLDGKKEDWIKLKEKVSYLRKYATDFPDIGLWVDFLEYVVGKFVDAFDGNVDEYFWQNIRNSPKMGSGSAVHITGWVLAFSPFAHDGKRLFKFDIKDITSGKNNFANGKVEPEDLVECGTVVPFKHVDFSGKETQLYIHGGCLTYRSSNEYYEPANGWCLLTDTKN
jgi:hypothetical protein